MYHPVQIVLRLFVPAHCRAAFNVATVYWTGSLSSLVTSGALLTLHRRDAALDITLQEAFAQETKMTSAAAGSSPWVTFISAPSGFYQSFVTTSMYLQQAIHMAYAGHCFIHSAHFLKMKVLKYSN